MPKVGYHKGHTRSLCHDCGNTAARFWGRLPYCNRCVSRAQVDEPMAHMCPTCKREQASQCEWFGTDPCGRCQEAGDQAGLCEHVMAMAKDLSARQISITGSERVKVKCGQCRTSYEMALRSDSYLFGAKELKDA